jgi:superfamily II DNA/RNA helicase
MKKIDQFRQRKVFIMICTDLASRGIDIPEVDLVIHYHLPKDIDTFIHRCGRTARLGRSGRCILIADGEDNGRFKKYKADLEPNKNSKFKNQTNGVNSNKEGADAEEDHGALRSQNGARIKKITVPIKKLDEIRTIVSQASKIETESFKLGQDVRDQKWMERMADEAGIELDKKAFSFKKIETDKREITVNARKSTLKKVYFKICSARQCFNFF